MRTEKEIRERLKVLREGQDWEWDENFVPIRMLEWVLGEEK